jgi:hypothetical protein
MMMHGLANFKIKKVLRNVLKNTYKLKLHKKWRISAFQDSSLEVDRTIRVSCGI